MANRYLSPFQRGSRDMSYGRPGLPIGTGSLFDLHRQMNRLFDDLLEGSDRSGSGQNLLSAPALEVHQAEDRVEITAELPGVRQEDIELTIENGVLTLCGEKRSTRTDQERGYSERSYGRFERSITLPSNIDEERCSADFKDGVLTITLPKSAERERGRRIPLGGGGQQPQQLAQNDQERPERQQAAQGGWHEREADNQQQA